MNLTALKYNCQLCVCVCVCVRARALVCLLGLVRHLRKTTKNRSTDGCRFCYDTEPDTFCLQSLYYNEVPYPNYLKLFLRIHFHAIFLSSPRY
jgi:hypothetical protein